MFGINEIHVCLVGKDNFLLFWISNAYLVVDAYRKQWVCICARLTLYELLIYQNGFFKNNAYEDSEES
jgi:hypothetical protein